MKIPICKFIRNKGIANIFSQMGLVEAWGSGANSLNESGLLYMAQNGTTGILSIVGIAVGVAVPNVLAQRYLQKRKNQRTQELMATRHACDGQ